MAEHSTADREDAGSTPATPLIIIFFLFVSFLVIFIFTPAILNIIILRFRRSDFNIIFPTTYILCMNIEANHAEYNRSMFSIFITYYDIC